MTRPGDRWNSTSIRRHLGRSLRVGPKHALVIGTFVIAAVLLWLPTRNLALAALYGLIAATLVSMAFVIAGPRRATLIVLRRAIANRQLNLFRLFIRPPTRPVIAGIASIPERSDSLRKAVASILPQVNHLYVYLNSYDAVPSYLSSPKVTVYRSQDHGDRADNGKFFGLQNHTKGVYFSLDDDLVYPADYVRTLIHALRQINFAGFVGVHGVYYPTAPRSFLDRRLLHYARASRGLRPVSLLGTGTAAFPIERINISLDVFKTPRMADVWLAKYAKEQGLPMVAVDRPRRWLIDSGSGDAPSSIWHSTKANHASTTAVIVDQRPWGLEDLLRRIDAAGLSPGLSKEWSEFVRFYERLQSSGAAAAVAHVPPFSWIADYITFYCTPADVLKTAKAALETVGWDTLLFRRTAAATMTYDPQQAADLFEHAMNRALRKHRTADVLEFGANASKACRLAGRFDRASEVLAVASAGNEDSEDLVNEQINLSLDRREYSRSRELLVHRSSLLARDFDYDFRLGLALASDESIEAAAPWIVNLFLNAENGRRQNKLISHLRYLYSPERRLKNTAAYRLLEDAIVRGGLDPLPTIHLHLALGDQKSAAELLEATRSRLHQSRPEYLPIIEAAVSAKFGDTIDHLNAALSSDGFAELALQVDETQSVLSQIHGKATPAEISETISVIMTAYDCASTIGYAIDSILNQSIDKLQLIVVDDCSTDGTSKIIEQYARRDSRILHVTSSANGGPYVCRNIGLQRADGTYIAIHDSDDYAHPQRLEYQVQRLKQEDWVACYVGHLRVTDDGGIVPDNHGELVGEGPMTLMMRRQVVDDLGYFVPTRSRGDMEHRDRMAAFYGSHRVGMDGSVLLLARDSLSSNSRLFDADPARLGVVPKTKAEARQRHLQAEGRRELLHVGNALPSAEDVTNSKPADNDPGPPVAEQREVALSPPAEPEVALGIASGATATAQADKPVQIAQIGTPPGRAHSDDSRPIIADHATAGHVDRFGPVMRLPRKIKGKYRRPLKREYLENGKLLDKLKEVRHPNLMSIYDYDDEYVYVEHISGLVLSNRSPFCPPQHTRCYIDYVDSIDLSPIKAAIQHLHAHGIAHSDVTSHNIMVTDDGALKLIDLICCLPPRRDFIRRDLKMFEDLEQEIRTALSRSAADLLHG